MKYIIMIGGALLLVLALVITFSYSVISHQTSVLNGTLIEPAEPVESFELMSGEGPVSIEDYYGSLLYWFLGTRIVPMHVLPHYPAFLRH